MNYKHTPGPWVLLPDIFDFKTNAIDVVSIEKTKLGDNISIATIFGSTFYGETEKTANANLIAAAPEMLEMMIMMLERLEDSRVAALWESPEEHEIEMDIYRKVIKKAKGESL